MARRPHPDDRRAFGRHVDGLPVELLPDLDAQGRAQEDEITASLTAQERTAGCWVCCRPSRRVRHEPGSASEAGRGLTLKSQA